MARKRNSRRVVLALSGGGFRATLFHLGVIAYLRQVGMLSRVQHICSASGGSILAGHLVCNWSGYNSGQADFNALADEVIRLTRCNVRGRIVRMLPLGLATRKEFATRVGERFWCRLFLGKPPVPGLLEAWFGRSIGNAEPENGAPLLSILATDLASGNLCALDSDAIVAGQRGSTTTIRVPVEPLSMERRIAASAAFPVLFPPVHVRHRGSFDSSPEVDELSREDPAVDLMLSALSTPIHSFADGGLLDNAACSLPFLCRTGRYSASLKRYPVQVGEACDPDDLLVLRSDAGAPFAPALRITGFFKLEGQTFGYLDGIKRGYDVVMRNHEVSLAPHTAGLATLAIGLRQNRQRAMTYDLDRVMYLVSAIRTDLDRFNPIESRWLLTMGQIAAHDALSATGNPAEIGRSLCGELPKWPADGLVGTDDGLWLPEHARDFDLESDFQALRHGRRLRAESTVFILLAILLLAVVIPVGAISVLRDNPAPHVVAVAVLVWLAVLWAATRAQRRMLETR